MKKLQITYSFEGELYKENEFYRVWITPCGFLIQQKRNNTFLKFKDSFFLEKFREDEKCDHVFYATSAKDTSSFITNFVILKTKDSISNEEYEKIMDKHKEEFLEGWKEVNYRSPFVPTNYSFKRLNNNIKLKKLKN